ncbi:MAG TPA: AIR synthase family protein [Vicinamibacteria bacterium]|nr:AIR synthase family protein [Vicinamibacteria bacterium]
MRFLPDGKLGVQLLRELISRLAIDDVHVAVGPAPGEDAAAIDRGDHYLLLASDPITFLPKRIGWYAVQVNANDIAAMGGTPQYFLSTILLPSGRATDEMVREIVADIAVGCRELGCLAVGGHTEVTTGIDRPIVVGAMVGEVERDKLLTSGGAHPGDMLVVTKGVAVEATAILAEELEAEVRQAFGDEFQRKAAGFLDDPGLSVLPASRAAVEAGGVTAMHDVTEGGLANALWEIAEASNVGLVTIDSEIPRFWESTKLAEYFGMDLLGAIGSGALVLTVREPETERLLQKLEASGNAGYVIGRVVESNQGVCQMRGENKIELPRFTTDEVSRVLTRAASRGKS